VDNPPVRACIDANVILRYVLNDHSELSAKAEAVFSAMEAGKAEVTCNPVTLAEVVWVLSSFYKVPHKEIADGLSVIVKQDGFHIPDKDRYLTALALFADNVPHFGDACCCAEALMENEGRLYSFDRALSSVPGINRSESPFSESPA